MKFEIMMIALMAQKNTEITAMAGGVDSVSWVAISMIRPDPSWAPRPANPIPAAP